MVSEEKGVFAMQHKRNDGIAIVSQAATAMRAAGQKARALEFIERAAMVMGKTWEDGSYEEVVRLASEYGELAPRCEAPCPACGLSVTLRQGRFAKHGTVGQRKCTMSGKQGVHVE